jgi:hypothetical protein
MNVETISSIAAIIGALSWPITILIIVFAFRELIASWLKVPSSFQQRTVRAKAGGFELELSAIEDIQKGALRIAEEPDPKKRLDLAKNLLKIDKVIPDVIDADVDALVELQNSSISNARLVNFWSLNEENPDLVKTYNKLEKLGLIVLENYYEGQCVAELSDLGKALIESLVGPDKKVTNEMGDGR